MVEKEITEKMPPPDKIMVAISGGMSLILHTHGPGFSRLDADDVEELVWAILKDRVSPDQPEKGIWVCEGAIELEVVRGLGEMAEKALPFWKIDGARWRRPLFSEWRALILSEHPWERPERPQKPVRPVFRSGPSEGFDRMVLAYANDGKRSLLFSHGPTFEQFARYSIMGEVKDFLSHTPVTGREPEIGLWVWEGFPWVDWQDIMTSEVGSPLYAHQLNFDSGEWRAISDEEYKAVLANQNPWEVGTK